MPFCRTSTLWLVAVFVIASGMVRLRAQPQDAPAATSVGPQAVKVVLKHFTVNPLASDPNTHQPLRVDGSWSLSKSRPASCQQETTCVEVFYVVPDQSARCSWVVSLNESGLDGTILDENSDADTYMVRMVASSEGAPFVKSRSKPVYPPIAVAAQVSGAVVTRVLVDRSGDVQHVRVISGPAMLQQASIDAAKNWKFTPMTINARTVQYEAELVFTFAHVTSDPRMVIVKTAP